MRDILFAAGCICYAVNRWILKPRLDSAFLQNWFNDLLLVPCAIPILFWLFRVFKLRKEVTPPTVLELTWILAVWSVLFEWIGPMFVPKTTGDWRDVVMYWSGGFLAWAFWKVRYPTAAVLTSEQRT